MTTNTTTNLGGTKNIETPFLKIRGNCLEIQNTTIQLSNISLFSTADVAPAKFPTASVILIVIGLALLRFIPGLAAAALVAGGLWIYFWYASAEKTKEMKRLTIITNSGNSFPIVFNDQAFLTDVVEVMSTIIRYPGFVRDVTVNMGDGTFIMAGNTFTNGASLIKHLYEKGK